MECVVKMIKDEIKLNSEEGRYLFQAYSVDEKIAEHDNLVKKM
ncbi:protein of unknown function [Clostridium beijerinckii]|nr:protein of unknown function [Clostridium beijerinckii]